MAAHGSEARFGQGGKTRFGTLLRRRGFTLDCGAFAVLKNIYLSSLVRVVFEDHSGEVAVGVGSWL